MAEEEKKEKLLSYLSKIINFKLQNVKKDKIDVTVDLNVPKDFKIPSFDMTIILGNLLDNALNAVKKLDENRFINIKMKYTKGRLILKMDNSSNHLCYDISRP